MFDWLKRKPDFLILGSQKAGTTSFERLLRKHPSIKCARTKEIGFFNRDYYYQEGEKWYAQQFPRRLLPGTLLFEGTPEYLYYPFVAERILRFHPGMKLLVLLRNPTQRAFSAWNMFRDFHTKPAVKRLIIEMFLDHANPEVKTPLLDLLNQPEFPDFESCVELELTAAGNGDAAPLEPSFVRRGLYADQISRFQALFPTQNLLVLDAARLRQDRAGTLNQALRFLGLSECKCEDEAVEDQNVRPYVTKLSDATRKQLDDFYRPHNAKLNALLGRDFGWNS
ncbi:MAG TPA: sulfotransferase [Candidatus Dormibacteraeota bacterium]|nr:sulfotransferase [Candidatus Dormibacteraeota bacterium]